MSGVEPDGTLHYRVTEIERDQTTLRSRIHDLTAEVASLRLLVQRVSDKVEHIDELCERTATETKDLRRSLVTMGLSTVSGAVLFALTMLVLFGKP